MQKEELITYSEASGSGGGACAQVRASTLSLGIMWFLLGFDMLGGPLRYYLSRIGLETLVYMPKIGCLLFVLFEVVRRRVRQPLFFIIIFLSFFAVIGLLHQITVLSEFFSVLLIAPFLLGITAAQYIWGRERAFISFITVVFFVTVLGVYFNVFFEFPWSGFAYTVSGSEIEGAREWTAMGIKRIAGFTRLSANASFYLVCTALFLCNYSRLWRLRIAIAVAALPAIIVTTNKAGAGGFAIGIIFMMLTKYPRALRFLVYALTVTAMLFPISSIIMNYDIKLSNPISLFLLFSFADRLLNTWPNFIAAVSKFGDPILGVGFGGVGTATKFFTGGRDVFAFADNFPLYLYGWFGVAAVGIFLYFAHVTNNLFSSRNRLVKSFAPVMIATIAASITTDIIESQVFSLMIGLCIATAYQHRDASSMISKL